MERNRFLILLFVGILLFPQFGNAQEDNQTDKEVYNYKLDYNVPESPAFSILDANPTTVMRGNAAQEVVISLASSIFSNNAISPGLALDVNPFFVFGGKLKNINEYKNNFGKRLLANTQFSFATVDSKKFPNDLLMSGGIRVTLFDSKDAIFDTELSNDIDRILIDDIPTNDPNNPSSNTNESKNVESAALKAAYKKAKERYMTNRGGSLSLGYAIAGRAINNSFKTDSIATYRHQVWLVGQYDFGKNKMSLNGMFMYRHEKNFGNVDTTFNKGIISGISLKHYGNKLIMSGEIIYNGIQKEIGFGAYVEAYLLPNISVYASYSKDEVSNSYYFKPGVKYNFSESKKIKK